MDQLGWFLCWIGNETFRHDKDVGYTPFTQRSCWVMVSLSRVRFGVQISTVATPSLLCQVLVLQLAPAVQLKIGRWPWSCWGRWSRHKWCHVAEYKDTQKVLGLRFPGIKAKIGDVILRGCRRSEWVKLSCCRRIISLYHLGSAVKLSLVYFDLSTRIQRCYVLCCLNFGKSQVPNIIMYSGAIGACGSHGEWQIALQLLHDMQHEDNLTTFREIGQSLWLEKNPSEHRASVS